MREALLTWAAAVEEAGATVRDACVDANRLRRMDRFGRSGVLAGSRALAAAGLAPVASPGRPDPRFGIIVGTAYGCRDAITRHERLLASASKVEDLAPSVFAATVHNTVAGELAIAWGLGGVAETLVSGNTAGLEALVQAVGRVARGAADRVLVVAAEGLDEEMRRAFARENTGRTLVESAAAVLVEAEGDEKEISSRRGVGAKLVRSELTFDGAARRERAEEREGFSEGVEAWGGGAAVTERLGASGLWEVAEDLVRLRGPRSGALSPHSPSRKEHRYVIRDAHGSSAAVTLEFFT